MLSQNTLAVAIVQRQVMLVQATRQHSQLEPWIDVYVYQPLGNRLFVSLHSHAYLDASDSFDSLEKSKPHTARIASKDLLAILSDADARRAGAFGAVERGVIELPLQAHMQFLELSLQNQKRMENMWGQWHSKPKSRSKFRLGFRFKFGVSASC